MSRFFSSKFKGLAPYTPGEQPRDMQYIKLNTNESPFPPPQKVADAVNSETLKNNLYSDPTCNALVEKLAAQYGVKKTQVLPTNGSDEILNFAFTAFCDQDTPAVFADITYGFYAVFADLYGVEKKIIPLREDFTIAVEDYENVKGTVFIANPNAPTGLALSRAEIERILRSNPDNVVVVDEAYVDFGGESCVTLIDKYENLLVTQTFSKSRSLAGARLGMGFANEKLIADLNAIKYSTNPYNVNRMTAAAGVAALEMQAYFDENCKIICENRAYAAKGLKELGFNVLESKTNFLFAQSEQISGTELYEKLKSRGILVRHFNGERIKNFNRITIGTKAQMQTFLEETKRILKEQEK